MNAYVKNYEIFLCFSQADGGSVIFLLKHPSEAKRLGENARKRYETKYSSKLFRRNMTDFYQSLYD